jgi:hypothetical protein
LRKPRKSRGLFTRRAAAWWYRSVGERLGEMQAPDLAGAIEIGDRPGEL